MKICFILIAFSVVALTKVAGLKGYYDCSEDDCSFYDTQDDPRNPYMDLFLKLEDAINDSLSLPNWKMGLEFYDGHLNPEKWDFDGECACPLILKEDKTFVTFHAYDDVDLKYSYKFPISEDKDGSMEIFFEYRFSALLMNETNRAPKFLKVEVNFLNIISFILYGVPLKWIDNLPTKYYNIVKDATYGPIKKLLEDALLQAFNQQLDKLYGPEFHGVHDNSVLYELLTKK